MPPLESTVTSDLPPGGSAPFMRLEDHPFFEQLDPKHVVSLLAHANTLEYEPAKMIFDEGDPSDCLYLVLGGKVGFSKRVEDGTYRSVSQIGPGTFFGEIGLFTGETRSVRAIAEDRCHVGIIPKDDMLDLIKNTPGPIQNILDNIINHLHGTTRHYIEDLLQQQKIAMVGSMVNTIIHDFKNPFTIIGLGAQVIARIHEDKQTQQICTSIESQIDRMVDMAEELNLFSKGHTQLSIDTVCMDDMIAKFKELNFPFFEKEHISIVIDIENVEFQAELNKLIRVLQNLVGNAIEAYNDQPGKIRICARKCDGYLELQVADDAGGIPETIRARFFEPFITHGKSKGTGLCTAIAKSIVENHHGTIHFDTETGKGTTFIVRIPLMQPVN